MFRGRFEHAMDEKGRIAIPARFRDLLLGSAEQATVVLTLIDQCLVAYALPEWEALEARVATLPQFDPKVAAFKRVFIGCAHECPLDRSGRILIPAELRREAKLETDCVVIGQLTKFEIWSAARWQKMLIEVSDQMPAISSTIAGYGVQL